MSLNADLCYLSKYAIVVLWQVLSHHFAGVARVTVYTMQLRAQFGGSVDEITKQKESICHVK